MFSDPFDSFHNVVSEAKEERENLDRLLTVSTPRERLLVAAIGLVLLVLAAWLFFGSVARTVAFSGVLVGPGEGLAEGSRAMQALVWAEGGLQPRLAPGMPTTVQLTNGGSTLDGTIAAIADVPLSAERTAIPPAAVVSVHRIELSVDSGFDAAAMAGQPCRLVVEIGREPPVALFGMRRS